MNWQNFDCLNITIVLMLQLFSVRLQRLMEKYWLSKLSIPSSLALDNCNLHIATNYIICVQWLQYYSLYFHSKIIFLQYILENLCTYRNNINSTIKTTYGIHGLWFSKRMKYHPIFCEGATITSNYNASNYNAPMREINVFINKYIINSIQYIGSREGGPDYGAPFKSKFTK